MSTLARPALDGASLRYARLAARAAEAAVDGATGLVWLEHVNIVVGDREQAEAFYFEEGLGCSRDPSKPGGPGSAGTMWANLGSQQFHLAEQADDDPPQAVRALGLALPDVAAAAARLQRLEARGACGPVEIHDADRFTATCPWGNVFHCYSCRADFSGFDAMDAKKQPKMVGLHARDGYGGGGAPFGVRGGPGVKYLQFFCDDAESAANAYSSEFGGATTHDGSAIDTRARERLRAHCFTNQRFKHLDTCDTLAEARASRTFRFAFPALPNVEHETRALSHEQFVKRVHYAPP
ncbi:hypothetical protein JL720_8317 [Aureococcus anophagefferens]|nr:hypothetical protein JL720_8317 [Aureococcus anophagefferens]